jgi:hypothetical protein
MRTAIKISILVGIAWLASSATPAPASPDTGPGIDVVSARLATVTPADGAPLPLLHVRMLLTNPDADLPWRFDPRATRIDLGRDGVTRPVLVNAETPTLPIVMVEPGAAITIDLFVVAPARVIKRSRIDKLVVRTRIATPDDRRQVVVIHRGAGRLAPATESVATRADDTTTWWAEPAYAWTTFGRRPGPVTTHPPMTAVVVAASRR